MKKLYVCCILLLALCVSSCSSSQNFSPDNMASKIKNETIVEESLNYKITMKDKLFYYYLIDREGNIVHSDGPFSHQPQIQPISDVMLKIVHQSGTGLGTNWGFFYNIEKSTYSDIFHYILNQNDELVILGEKDKIVVKDIFGDLNFYQEFSSFEYTLSNVVSPFISSKFIENNKIEITYISGEDYEIKKEVFDIKIMCK